MEIGACTAVGRPRRVRTKIHSYNSIPTGKSPFPIPKKRQKMCANGGFGVSVGADGHNDGRGIVPTGTGNSPKTAYICENNYKYPSEMAKKRGFNDKKGRKSAAFPPLLRVNSAGCTKIREQMFFSNSVSKSAKYWYSFRRTAHNIQETFGGFASMVRKIPAFRRVGRAEKARVLPRVAPRFCHTFKADGVQCDQKNAFAIG